MQDAIIDEFYNAALLDMLTIEERMKSITKMAPSSLIIKSDCLDDINWDDGNLTVIKSITDVVTRLTSLLEVYGIFHIR